VPGRRVVLITGATPYLGGPCTWRPLREAAPDLAFVEIDPLDFADAPDLTEACRHAVLCAARDARAVVAHYTAAKPAIEALAQMAEALPVLLLSPLLLRRSAPPLSAVRAVIETRLGGRLLAWLAHSKSTRLSSDRQYLKKQLLMFVDEVNLTDALFEEAAGRAKDPRTARSVERVAQIFLEITNPIDPEVDAKVYRRTVLLGTSPLDRKTAARMPATTLPNVRGAAMIEAPQAVVQALRKMLTTPVNP
jgi:hypothetical protein